MQPPGGLTAPMLSADEADGAFAAYFALPPHRAWAWNSAGPYFIAHGHPSRDLAGLDAMKQCQQDQVVTTKGTCSLFLLDDEPRWPFHPVTGRPIAPLVAEADVETRSRLLQNFRRFGSASPTAASVAVDADFPFTSYIRQVHTKISKRWSPAQAAPHGGEHAVILFVIHRDGSIKEPSLERSSGNDLYDQAALRAVSEASPFPPLPPEFKAPSLRVRFGFDFKPATKP